MMGNFFNVYQKVYTPVRKDAACQVEFLTRAELRRSHSNNVYIGGGINEIAHDYGDCTIELSQLQTREELSAYDKSTGIKTMVCGNCTINLDQGVKICLEPCKHILCLLCYSNIYWKGEKFPLCSAHLQTCYECNTRLIEFSTDINDKYITLRHSLCNLTDYVNFNYKDKVLQFVDLPQVSFPYQFVLSSRYFPLGTPQAVQEDIITYISIIEDKNNQNNL